MLRALFTLDYEIHGNGEGSPWALMVEPTNRMLMLFEEYGAKLTIMADVAEILKFQEYKQQFGRDDFHSEAILEQLRDAIRRGHDVQLHLHSSYFNAKHEDGCWRQDWSEYNFAGLGANRLNQVVRLGKEFLESLLRPVNPDYKCDVFRAANWSVSPSREVVRALVANGIRIDTSVFKHGRRQGLVNFDYTNADSDLVPWRADENDICARDVNGRLWEFPIYCERRWLGAFLTPQRIYRAAVSRLHRFSRNGDIFPAIPATASNPQRKPTRQSIRSRGRAWKADFNQCTGRQLIGALERAERNHGRTHAALPFVLIGHSKLFTRFNAWSLRSFLKFVADHPQKFGFGRFGDFDKLDFETDAAGNQVKGSGSALAVQGAGGV